MCLPAPAPPQNWQASDGFRCCNALAHTHTLTLTGTGTHTLSLIHELVPTCAGNTFQVQCTLFTPSSEVATPIALLGVYPPCCYCTAFVLLYSAKAQQEAQVDGQLRNDTHALEESLPEGSGKVSRWRVGGQQM